LPLWLAGRVCRRLTPTLPRLRAQLFVAGEVGAALFGQSPTAFLQVRAGRRRARLQNWTPLAPRAAPPCRLYTRAHQELRVGKYSKTTLVDPAALALVAALGLPVEGAATGAGGAAALPPATVQQLMVDRRRLDLLQPFRLALLKLTCQEATRMMAEGNYEAAQPVALEAVKQARAWGAPAAAGAPPHVASLWCTPGSSEPRRPTPADPLLQGEALFRPRPAMQMFPLFLLLAQANLGLRWGRAGGGCVGRVHAHACRH
jgi:hypothetical protein